VPAKGFAKGPAHRRLGDPAACVVAVGIRFASREEHVPRGGTPGSRTRGNALERWATAP